MNRGATRLRRVTQRDLALYDEIDAEDGGDRDRGRVGRQRPGSLAESESRNNYSAYRATLVTQLILLGLIIALSYVNLRFGPIAQWFVFGSRTSEFNGNLASEHIAAIHDGGARVAGTQNLINVQKYVLDTLESFRGTAVRNGWRLKVDEETLDEDERGSQAMALSAGRFIFYLT